MKKLLIAVAACGAVALQAWAEGEWDKILDASRPEGLVIYDVGDYVQDGLVSHFDGIRNAGANLPHDDAAETWVNLVAGEPNATFYRFENDTASKWVANGYDFVASRATMESAGAALGNQFTIQLATTVDYTKQNYGANCWPNFFSAENDFCIYYNNNGATSPTTSLIWKTESYGETGSETRPKGSYAEGRYITAIMEADKQRLIFGTDKNVGFITNRTKTEAVPAMQWRWGGSSSLGRSLRGVIHSVRLYNRALTNEELEHNRRIDDTRFRTDEGMCNVRVQSAVSGAEANEVTGNYDVNGEYVFTTPQSVTVGDATFKPAGYQLDVWNTTYNAWEFAGVSGDTSFAYTNCAARARVRLTWLWEMNGGKMKLDADAYAPLGLVGNFDGIRNVGIDAAHDGTTKTWKNLAGNLNAVHNPISRDGAWLADGYRCVGGDAWRWGEIDLGHNFSVQCATDVYTGEQLENGGKGFNGSENTWPTPFGSLNDIGNIYGNGRSNGLTFKCDGIMGGAWDTGTRATANWGNGYYLTAIVALDRSGITTDVALPTFKDPYHYKGPIGSRTYFFGGIDTGTGIPNRAARCMIGTIYSTRVYNRVITSVEMKWNRLIDDARFRGLHAVAVTGLVQVANSAAKGIGADDTLYLLRDGSVTVTAPATVEQGGVTYTCTGYRIETYAAGAPTFATTERGTENTYTFTADTSKNRRLVWEWKAVGRLRTAADYDVSDYVQEGLVYNLDGIHNVGANMPHDATSITWHDISPMKNRSYFYGKNVSKGSWTNGMSYAFNETSYAQMTNNLSLGKELTCEQVLDIDIAKQTQDFPNYAATYNDYGIFTRKTSPTALQWKQDYACGPDWNTRPTMQNWKGSNIVAVATTDKTYLFEGTTYANGMARRNVNDFGTHKWSVGAAAGNYAEQRYSIGRYFATRIYNRALSEAELAHNRKVDDVRFRGAVVTNVVVASAHDEAHGTEANGVYEVDGSWTFTAAPTVLASGKTARPTGYSIETLTPGGWSAPVKHMGELSYTYDAATMNGAPVRLTWRYDSGMAILIR